MPHSRRINAQRALSVIGLGVLVSFLIFLALTGRTWKAISYSTVVLFASLFLLAIYFWGSMILGGLLETLTRHAAPAPWIIDIDPGTTVPEHNLDPGLELIAAGMLVYRLGEVRPQMYFRRVPLNSARAVRPFIVARTGANEPYHFDFRLLNERDQTHFEDHFALDLGDAPVMVMPAVRLKLDRPRRLVGQRWTLHVRTGSTIITTLRFMFVEGGAGNQDESITDWQRDLLARLLDEALKRDVMTRTQEIVWEEL